MPITLPTTDQLVTARALTRSSQGVLAPKAGMASKTLISVEHGISSLVRYEAVVDLYRRYGITFRSSSDFSVQEITRVHSGPIANPGMPIEHLVDVNGFPHAKQGQRATMPVRLSQPEEYGNPDEESAYGAMPNNMPTADLLTAARILIRLNQEVIAERTGLTAKTIISVEQGKSSLSAYNALVATYLGLGIHFNTSADFRVQTITRIHSTPVRNVGIHVQHLMAAA